MRYWLYKCNIAGGPAGYWGDWRGLVFNKIGPVQWGGDDSTRSREVSHYLAGEISPGDVIVAYQTDLLAVVGYCTVARIIGRPKKRKLWLQPFEVIDPPFRIHDHKQGSVLERSIAVNGPVMLRELGSSEVKALLDLTGGPRRVLRGQPRAAGWNPRKAPPEAHTE